ncbi:hypothetical protein GCM10010339_81170 [Streptomyces alanosinicus]|uniref:Uncharacterized protein n=1 Tax=Streptomyces alanosinicus TaxID=68171 RepID=A0A918YRQ7_9ACTN|nr:hypothetical protein GCM10010339_81170 [Streptomyces alanosinicus]
MTAVTAIAAENSTSGRCHDRYESNDRYGGRDRYGRCEDIRKEFMTTPKVDSGTIRYPIAPLSIIGWRVGKGPARWA